MHRQTIRLKSTIAPPDSRGVGTQGRFGLRHQRPARHQTCSRFGAGNGVIGVRSRTLDADLDGGRFVLANRPSGVEEMRRWRVRHGMGELWHVP